METDEIQRQARTCETCKTEFFAAVCLSPFTPGKILAIQRHCDSCVENHNRIAAMDRAAARRFAAANASEDVWKAMTADEFRTTQEGGSTDAARLEREQPRFSEIVSHPLGPVGLILRGSTGAGKTRCMFRLFRRYHEMDPRPKLIAMTAGEFDRQARDSQGTFTLTPWFDRLATADALFIDDVGKGKWTEGTAGQFWEIVDNRTKNRRPIFLTTNTNGENLVANLKLDRDTAEPLLRRLREHCKVIVCKPNP